jgi:hypothetical protein
MAWNNYPGRRVAAGGTGKKYGNKKIYEDGEVFDSKKEYRRWKELILLVKAGEISKLQRQVKYTLIPSQREPDIRGPRGGIRPGKLIEREVSYIADFVYTDKAGQTVVEDCKGLRTKEYIIKRKLMLHEYGIRIKET